MKKKIGLKIIVLTFCALTLVGVWTYSRKETDDSRKVNLPEGIIFDACSEDDQGKVSNGTALARCGIKSDSYVRDFLNNKYAVEFDSEAYEEKLREQMPENCVSIYDSELYVHGTRYDMMRQYEEYWWLTNGASMSEFISTNSKGETILVLVIADGDYRKPSLQVYLVETSKGLEVMYMRDFEEEYSSFAYNDGYMYTVSEHDGKADLYFTQVDENGDFKLVLYKHYEAEMDENGVYINLDDFYDQNYFEERCRKYVERQGLDFNQVLSLNTGSSYLGCYIWNYIR